MNNSKLARLFKRFLKENNAYVAYRRNFVTRDAISFRYKHLPLPINTRGLFMKCDQSTFDHFVRKYNRMWMLANVFEWANTPQGHQFWNELYDKWSVYKK